MRLKEQIRTAALETVVAYFHTESRTHIVYVPWMGVKVAKGFGDFTEGAYADFVESLDQMLATATAEDLSYWLNNLAHPDR